MKTCFFTMKSIFIVQLVLYVMISHSDHPDCDVVLCPPGAKGHVQAGDNRRWQRKSQRLNCACRSFNSWLPERDHGAAAVLHQVNIQGISQGQADTAALPRQTYGTGAEGVQFSQTALQPKLLKESV